MKTEAEAIVQAKDFSKKHNVVVYVGIGKLSKQWNWFLSYRAKADIVHSVYLDEVESFHDGRMLQAKPRKT